MSHRRLDVKTSSSSRRQNSRTMSTLHNLNQRSVARRRGMANILGGLSEQDLLTLHQTYRSHAPTSPVEQYDTADDEASRDPFSDVNDAVFNRPDSRQRARRNAICYNSDTEQIIRNIVRDVHIATYLNDLKLKNGYVQ